MQMDIVCYFVELFSLTDIPVSHDEKGHSALVAIPPLSSDDVNRTGKVITCLSYVVYLFQSLINSNSSKKHFYTGEEFFDEEWEP